MKAWLPFAGGIAFLAAGWLAGRGTGSHPAGRENPPRPAHAPPATTGMPRDFSLPGAKAWLVALDAEQLAAWILRTAKEPENRHRERRLAELFRRMFELDATAAADLWLKIEADCQPDLKGEIERWAARAPDEAAEWFSRSAEELRRYRCGRLVVDLAETIIGSVTMKDPERGVRLLMGNPAFYDPGSMFHVVLELRTLGNARLMEEVVRWAARQGDEPAHSLRTLSGFRIDAGRYPLQLLAGLDPDAAIRLLDGVPENAPWRDDWRDSIRSGWSERDNVAAMTWWVAGRTADREWTEDEVDPLMNWARSKPDEWLPWMVDHVPAEVADRAMLKAIELTSPPSLMHLRLCAAIGSEDLREKAAALIRSKGDPAELKEAAKGRPDLEVLLESGDDG